MQRKDGKRGRKLTGMLAVLLAMGLVAAAVFPMSARATEDTDPAEKYGITLTLPAAQEDEEAETIQLNVYQIATGELTGNQAYTYTATDAFGKLSEALEAIDGGEDNTDEAKAFAQEAAKLVRDGKIEAYASGAVGSKIEAGLGYYLVLADGEFDTENETIVTKAETTNYRYQFQPVLVSVAGKDVEGELKPTREAKPGRLTITKEMKGYKLEKPTVFIFQIDITNADGKVVESFVRPMRYELSFSKDEIQSLTIEDLPLGATVRVTEVYSGANSINTTPVNGVWEGKIVSVDDPTSATVNTAEFQNEFNDTYYEEGWIDNVFTTVENADGTMSWSLTSIDNEGNTKSDNWGVSEEE